MLFSKIHTRILTWIGMAAVVTCHFGLVQAQEQNSVGKLGFGFQHRLWGYSGGDDNIGASVRYWAKPDLAVQFTGCYESDEIDDSDYEMEIWSGAASILYAPIIRKHSRMLLMLEVGYGEASYEGGGGQPSGGAGGDDDIIGDVEDIIGDIPGIGGVEDIIGDIPGVGAMITDFLGAGAQAPALGGAPGDQSAWSIFPSVGAEFYLPGLPEMGFSWQVGYRFVSLEHDDSDIDEDLSSVTALIGVYYYF